MNRISNPIVILQIVPFSPSKIYNEYILMSYDNAYMKAFQDKFFLSYTDHYVITREVLDDTTSCLNDIFAKDLFTDREIPVML